MMIPSIDVMGGRAVQLVGGERLEIDAGDPLPIARRFARVGEMAVIDLDAAMGNGENRSLIEEIVRRYPCRVGGGIRDAKAALGWLDAGAGSVILGTAARREVLERLPRERVMAALDARDGEVVVEGWKRGTGAGVFERIAELKDLVGGFLVTFVEREGRMSGLDLGLVEKVVAAAAPVPVTVAGGVSCARDVAEIDGSGADVQVGMALYSGAMGLAEGLVAPMGSDREDGLWPTVVVDERGVALGLCWSNLESVREAVETGRGVYWSRRRGLWRKGETSGNSQELIRVDLDCDRDALRFTVRQLGGGFCHKGTRTCWGDDRGVGRLARTLAARTKSAPEGSYTRRLLEDRDLLRAKLEEEALELAEAETEVEIVHETADVFYFALTAMVRGEVPLWRVEEELDHRSLKMSRRPGDAKERRDEG